MSFYWHAAPDTADICGGNQWIGTLYDSQIKKQKLLNNILHQQQWNIQRRFYVPFECALYKYENNAFQLFKVLTFIDLLFWEIPVTRLIF